MIFIENLKTNKKTYLSNDCGYNAQPGLCSHSKFPYLLSNKEKSPVNILGACLKTSSMLKTINPEKKKKRNCQLDAAVL